MIIDRLDIISPVRKPGLTAFRTPGFQALKTQSTSLPSPHRDVVHVSSDSSPSTYGQVKRDSSGLSIVDDEPSPHPPKRQKVATSEDKENVLRNSSKVNQLVPHNTSSSSEHKNSDLASVIEWLNDVFIDFLTIFSGFFGNFE